MQISGGLTFSGGFGLTSASPSITGQYLVVAGGGGSGGYIGGGGGTVTSYVNTQSRVAQYGYMFSQQVAHLSLK
jgi:hypothetical protein